jgi:iron-sulfur cluster assembly protein
MNLTQLASNKIKQNLNKRGSGVGIRVGVKTTGCSGMAYVLEYLDTRATNPLYDKIWEFDNGVCVVANVKDLVYIDGMTIDYKRNGLNEGFEFINPNERDRCGCGESFRI